MTTIESTMTVANKVLKAVKKQIKGLHIPPMYLEPYQNGREHGLSLISQDKQVCFSEFRNTDSIVVYCGNMMEFSMAGNVPSDKVYQSKKFFSYGDYEDAAKFIVEYLK